MALKIGITQTETNAHNYGKWILESNKDIEIIILSFENPNYEDVRVCDGVLFTGGVDIHPSRYSFDVSSDYPNAPLKFLPERDTFELAVLEICVQSKIPVLGICRGLQLINVFFGGTLMLDIGESGCWAHKKELNTDKIHKVKILEDSDFFKIVNLDSGVTNSAHHQVIDLLANDLKAVAFSEEKFIEAIEHKNTKEWFIMAVQWHPERMPDQTSPLTRNIKEAFLKASKQNSNHVIVNN
jgi:putative glutamine amidotransferase